MSNKKIARRYSQALYGISHEKNILQRIKEDIILLQSTIENSRDLSLLLTSPIIKSKKKSDIVNNIFKGRLDKITLSLLELLTNKNRLNVLYDICCDFIQLLNEKSGIVEAHITTAIELTEKEKKQLIDSLKKIAGKEIIPVYSVNSEIKGGFIAQVKDTIYDASIKRQLELLQDRFKTGNFINN